MVSRQSSVSRTPHSGPSGPGATRWKLNPPRLAVSSSRFAAASSALSAVIAVALEDPPDRRHTLVSAWFVGQQAQELRCHADQMSRAVKADVQQVFTSADDLTALVQLGKQRPGLRVFRDLLHPAEQRKSGALGVAPPILCWWQWFSGHGLPSRLTVLLVAADRRDRSSGPAGLMGGQPEQSPLPGEDPTPA